MTANHPQPRDTSSDPFTQKVEPDKNAPTLDREVLRLSQIVQYKGVRFIEYDKDGATQKTRKHIFASQGGAGPWFSLWGSMNLDSQLRQLRPAAVFKLTYLGQEDLGENNKPFTWEVLTTSATPAQVDQIRQREPWPDHERQLLEAIARQAAEEHARRDARRAAGDPAADAGDDDLPF